MGGFELGNLTGQRGLPIEVRHDKAPHPFAGMRGPKQLTGKGAADGANLKRLQVANVYSETNLVVSTDSGATAAQQTVDPALVNGKLDRVPVGYPSWRRSHVN